MYVYFYITTTTTADTDYTLVATGSVNE